MGKPSCHHFWCTQTLKLAYWTVQYLNHVHNFTSRWKKIFYSSWGCTCTRCTPPAYATAGTVVRGGRMFYCWCFFLSFFLFSTRDLRAPSADRRETSSYDRTVLVFDNPGPKILGALPSQKKLGGQKPSKIWCDFAQPSVVPF